MSIEEEKQSQFSPGSVLPEELLLRIIYYPSHIDDDGKLRPEAIPTQDLRERGFSVYRKHHVTCSKITNVIDTYVSRKSERECRGIAPVLCKTVRNINDREDKQAFHVLDDAKTQSDKAHAEIKYTHSYTKSQQKGLRDKLKHTFTTILEVELVCSELKSIKLANSDSKSKRKNKSIITKINEYFFYYCTKLIALIKNHR